MTPTFKDAIKIVRQLPLDEREKLRDWIDEENQKQQTENQSKVSELEKRNIKFKKALKWIDEHRREFDGQFVVLEGDKLIAHGENPKELYEIARSKGIRSPFIKRVKAEISPFGGW